MENETLKFELRDHIGWLTLNRPEMYNALSWQAMLDLRDFFGSLEDNLDVRVVVMRGEGRHFCVGLDMKDSPGYEGGIFPPELYD